MSSILLTAWLIAATPSFEAQTLDGKTLKGPLVEWTGDRLSVDTPDGPVSVETQKLLSLSAVQKPAPARAASGMTVELVDGSIIAARQYGVQSDRAKITLPGGEEIEAPANAVRTVRFQQKSDPLAAEWSRLAETKAPSDLLVLHKDQSIDYLKGVLHDVTQDVVRFDLDGDVLPIKRAKIYGLIYHHGAGDELPAAACRITDAAGSQWSAKTLGLAERLQWTTPSGVSVSLPVEQVVKIDFSSDKLVYLSDMKPDSVAWTPYFNTAKPLPAMEQFYAPRYDRGFDSSPMRLGGAQYVKGLALHTRTELVYRLPAAYQRFQAIVGIDDAVRPNGKVRLSVRGDDKMLFEAVIAGSDAPQTVDLDVAGVRRLTILADFTDGPNVGDHLLLCNARLGK